MNTLEVGDTKKAICESCETLSDVTFEVRGNVMVGVCNICNLAIVLTHQSTPEVTNKYDEIISELFDMFDNRVISLEVMITYALKEGIPRYYIHNYLYDIGIEI